MPRAFVMFHVSHIDKSSVWDRDTLNVVVTGQLITQIAPPYQCTAPVSVLVERWFFPLTDFSSSTTPGGTMSFVFTETSCLLQ